MKRRLPLFLATVFFVAYSFNGDAQSKKNYYKSSDNQGYIIIKKDVDKVGNVILKTKVNANFDNEKLNFNLETVCDSDNLMAATHFEFDGTIDSNMNTVNFTGDRVKSVKNGSFWHFKGDFKNRMSPDPEVKQFIEPEHRSSVKLPLMTIPSFNIFAIVPNLKLDKNAAFVFNSLDETKLRVRKNQTINYLGKDNDLHKFIHVGKGMRPAYYWVNDNKELVKILLDDKYEFTLSEKEVADQSNATEGND